MDMVPTKTGGQLHHCLDQCICEFQLLGSGYVILKSNSILEKHSWLLDYHTHWIFKVFTLEQKFVAIFTHQRPVDAQLNITISCVVGYILEQVTLTG